MTNPRNPDDAYRSNPADQPYRSADPYRSSDNYRSGDPTRANDPYGANDLRDPAPLDNELQGDPELAAGPASGGRIAMFAVAVALILGAVFYGLNNSSINQAGTSSTAQNTTQSSSPASPPAAPPGMRDVTPRANTDQGVTTGAAPVRPAQPPAAAPADNTSSK